MDETRAQKEALFRYSVLGGVVSRRLRRGELKRALRELARKVWTDPWGKLRVVAAKTLEEWFYRYRRHGFDGLLPRPRSDRGRSRVLPADVRTLILDLKREDYGRSAYLILKELEEAGVLRRGQVSVSTIQRLLRREGLSGPRRELERPVRLRWQASQCGELWQGDALHGPKLLDRASGREVRVKIFALLDDRSRLVPYLRADFHETQQEFLTVLLGAILRRGIPGAILLDNHGSFTGFDVEIACAKLGTRLVFARPYDGPAKGKIERFWRTLRAHCLDRLEPRKIESLDDLNLRLSAWIESEYNSRPHSSLSGKSPLAVWEEDSDRIRWVEEPGEVEKAFTHTLERRVRGDSTCQVWGRAYEVPSHLRGRTVKIHYSLLRRDHLWIDDGDTRVFIREVDAQANAKRPRPRASNGGDPQRPATGLNPVEDLLRRITRPQKGKEENDA